jgi:hypothetical protein
MNAERAQAYGRVMKTLSDMGPSKLQPRERDLVRETADAMLFADGAEQDAHAVMAMRALQQMAENLVESERWLFESADRLLRDIEECGPEAPVEVEYQQLAAAA